MSPLPPPEERNLWAVGARRVTPGSPSAPELVATLRELGRERTELVALLDADAVAGERHLLSAWAHLGRARARGGARLRDRGAEFVLYVAGDDQLPRALAKAGVGDATERFVLAAERPWEAGPLLERFHLVADPTAYPKPASAELLERLGIGSTERSAVPVAAWEGLVLERVALVDLGAGPAHRAPTKA